MTVILLRGGKYKLKVNGECEKNKEIMLENASRIIADKLCWDKDKLVAFVGSKVFEITFTYNDTFVVEYYA